MRPWVSWLVTLAGGIAVVIAFYAVLPSDVRDDIGAIISDPLNQPSFTGSTTVGQNAPKSSLGALGSPGPKGDAEEPGPAKRRYELTPAGHELLRAWAKALAQTQQVVDAFLKRFEGR